MLSQLYYINVREGQRDNQEWTIQKHGQPLAQHKQRRQKKFTTQKTKKISNTDPTKKSRVNPCALNGKLFPILTSGCLVKLEVKL